MFMAFLDLLALIVSLAVSLAIVVRLSGILIRYRCVRGGEPGRLPGSDGFARANYNPKALNLDSEGGATPYTGPGMCDHVAAASWLTRPTSDQQLLCDVGPCLADRGA